MRAELKNPLSCLLFLCSCLFQAQNKIDSLKDILKTSKEDTGRVVILMKLGDTYQNIDPDSAIHFHSVAKLLAEKIHEEFKAQEALNQIAYDHTLKGEYNEALTILNSLAGSINDKTNKRGGGLLKAKVWLNMGAIYFFRADNVRALDAYFHALKISESLNDRSGTAKGLLNIGMIYRMQEDYVRALDHDMRALKIVEQLTIPKLQAKILGEIGNVYKAKSDDEQALSFYLKALKITEETRNKGGMVIWLSNVGTVLMDQSRFDQALEYYLKTIELAQEVGDKNSLAITYGNLAQLFMATKKYADAEKYLVKALAINHELNGLEGIEYQEKTYSTLDSLRGNFKGAYEHYKKYIAARDSIQNEENTKEQTRLEMQYEFDKKESAAKAEQEKKDAMAVAEKKRQNIILLSVAGFGLLVLGFAIFAYRSFLQKKKANEEISKQKDLIEEKQKEILDSIFYARRIQRSLLTNEKYIQKQLQRQMNLSR